MTSTVGKIRTSTGSIRVKKSSRRRGYVAENETRQWQMREHRDGNFAERNAERHHKAVSNIRQNGALFVPTPFTQML